MRQFDGQDRDGVDAVIVLGAAVVAPGVPSAALVRRVRHGVAVFRERGAQYFLVTGGEVIAPPAEASLMRQLAMELGVEDEKIVVEDRARNTFENAVFSGRIIRERGWRRLIVVTDAYHLPRALFVFRYLGLFARGAGVPKPRGISRMIWCFSYMEEVFRLARSAFLFSCGAHRALLESEWH